METFEDLLKEVGLTDEERAGLSPKRPSAFEEKLTKVATERDEARNRFTQREQEWEDVKENVWNPKVANLESQIIAAREDAAKKAEQLAIAKEWGLFKEPKASAPPQVTSPQQPAP